MTHLSQLLIMVRTTHCALPAAQHVATDSIGACFEEPLRMIVHDIDVLLATGAQAVVAWALSRAAPDSKLSMVAEEDSDSLRCEAVPNQNASTAT